jgi:hypothetical protein
MSKCLINLRLYLCHVNIRTVSLTNFTVKDILRKPEVYKVSTKAMCAMFKGQLTTLKGYWLQALKTMG